MLIVAQDLTQASGNTTSISNEVSTLPGSNLRVLQPSVRARTATISDTPYLEAYVGGTLAGGSFGGSAYNLVAVVGYDGNPSRNWHRSALDDPSLGPWTLQNCVIAPASSQAPPDAYPHEVLIFNVAAGAASYVEQVFAKPGKSSGIGAASLALSSARLFRQVDDIDARIMCYSGAGGTHYAMVDFDLSAGTAGTPADGGSFTADGAAITDLGDGWYLCRLDYTTDTANDLTVRHQTLTSGGSTTMAGGEQYHIGAPVTMLQSADWATTAEYPIIEDDGSGPMFQARLARGASMSNENTSARSGWKHAATRNLMRDFGRYGFFHKYSSNQSEQYVRVELWDPYNANAYIEAGRLIVGKAMDLTAVHSVRYVLGAEESGGEAEMDGGQIYRPQRTVRRRHEIEVRYASEAQAMDDLYRMQRVQGRSRQILVIGDEDNDEYQQEYMIYGFIDSLEPMATETQDPSGSPLWSWRFTVRETP